MNNPVSTILTHPRSCLGCISHKRDVMISFALEGEKSTDPIHDIFLTKEQAEKLLESLAKTIELNKYTWRD